MDQSPTEKHIDIIKEGLESLASPLFARLIFFRNISVHLAILSYILYLFLNDSLLGLSAMFSTILIFSVLQLIILVKFQYSSSFSVSDYRVLYSYKTRFQKVIVWFLFGGVIFLLLESLALVYMSSSDIATVIQSKEFIQIYGLLGVTTLFLFGSFITDLTSEILKMYDTIPIDEIEDGYESLDTEQVAEKLVTGSFTRNQEFDDNEEMTRSELKQSALHKLDKSKNEISTGSVLALEPEELDRLTDEELDILTEEFN